MTTEETLKDEAFRKMVDEYLQSVHWNVYSPEYTSVIKANIRIALSHFRKDLELTLNRKETIRCMSEVMTDIALALDIPVEKHGDPDEIFHAIEELQRHANLKREG